MSVFSFLDRTKKDVGKVASSTFHFLSDVATQKNQTANEIVGRATRNLIPASNAIPSRAVASIAKPVISATRYVARVPETAARSVLQGANAVQHLHNPSGVPNQEFSQPTQNTGLKEALYGKEPIQTYQKRYSGNVAEVQKSRFKGAAVPLSFLGTAAGAGLDVTGFGGGEKAIAQQGIKDLVKAASAADAKQILIKHGINEVIADKVAPAIAGTKDPHIIQNLLVKEHAALPPAVAPGQENAIINPAETVAKQNAPVVGQDIVSATVPKVAQEVAPKTTPISDPFEEILGAVHGQPGQKGLASKVAEQEKLLSQERGARFAQSAQAGKAAEGSAGYFAEKSALKGSYGKVEFTPLVHDIGPNRAEELFTSARSKINSTPDETYQELGLHPQGARLNTQTAVRKVLGLEPGLVTRSELKLLSIYSPKLAKEAAAARPAGRKIFDAAAAIFGSARAAKSTLDLSMGGRQGLFVAARHPIEWAKANVESVKYAKNSKYYINEMKTIHNDEWGKLIDKYNPSVLTGGASHEEQYAASDLLTSKTAKKVGIGHLVAGSERAYTGGLTTLRKQLLTKSLQIYGATAEEAERALGKKGVDGLIEAISTLTGRGGKAGGFVQKHATTLQEALFSPRLWASRLQPLNPAFWKRIGPAGRKEALESLGAFAAVAGVVLGAAAANGAEVETDPRSSDFLKVKVGDTRYDILGGFQQNLVFGARQALGFSNTIAKTNFKTTKSSVSGRLSKFGEGFGAPTQLTSAFDLVRNKANPVLGAAANIIEGKDKAGNKINPLTEIGQLFVPINIQQAYNARQNPKDVIKGLPDVVGIGSQTYGLKDINVSEKQKEYIQKLKSSGAPQDKIEASQRFYQTLKTGPDRNQAEADIKSAVKANDLKGAVQLAKEYNQKYRDTFNDWRSQYGKFKTDETLVKSYHKRLITDDSFDTLVNNVKKGR